MHETIYYKFYYSAMEWFIEHYLSDKNRPDPESLYLRWRTCRRICRLYNEEKGINDPGFLEFPEAGQFRIVFTRYLTGFLMEFHYALTNVMILERERIYRHAQFADELELIQSQFDKLSNNLITGLPAETAQKFIIEVEEIRDWVFYDRYQNELNAVIELQKKKIELYKEVFLY